MRSINHEAPNFISFFSLPLPQTYLELNNEAIKFAANH